MNKLFILTILFLSHTASAQWIMSTGTASYEHIQQGNPNPVLVNMPDSADVLEVCYTSTSVYVRTNNLAGYQMGPWSNPNVPLAQPSIYELPRYPQEKIGTKSATPSGGPVAITVNGVKVFGYGDAKSYSSSSNGNVGNGDGNWFSDAWVSEGATLDATGLGHANNGGNYHYHATPIALYSTTNTGHSPIIGFAFDGYPIYGPFGYSDAMNSNSSVVRMNSSYQLRNITQRTVLPNGQQSVPAGPAVTTNGNFDLGTYIQDYEYVNNLGHLDEYNGRLCVTPEYPSGIYAYFVTTKSNGDPAFPYMLAAEYYGVVDNNHLGPNLGNATIPAGANCGTISNITALQQPETLTLYPNPTDGTINLELEAPGNHTIQLINILGSTVYNTTQYLDYNHSMNLKDFNKGIYTLILTHQRTGKSFSNKVVLR